MNNVDERVAYKNHNEKYIKLFCPAVCLVDILGGDFAGGAEYKF